MKCPHCSQTAVPYKNPIPTVDVIICIDNGIVLIERKNPPPGWALPGGFVDYGETLEHAAIREAKEETSLDIELLRQFRSYSDPQRDARFHTITTVFIAQASGIPEGRDDAKHAKIFIADSLPPLAFDHAKILTDFFLHKKP